MFYSADGVKDPMTATSVVLGNVVYNGQEWDIHKALKTKGLIKIKYTGQPIKPTVKSVKYRGVECTNATNAYYFSEPWKYHYKYLYGNPNPEDGKDVSTECVNVTGSRESDLTCMTVRYSPGGNFTNYTNVFFEITPASIANDVQLVDMPTAVNWTGRPAEVSPTLVYNGMTLEKDRDFTLSYQNNGGLGTATVTITGKGNYEGSIARTFTINSSNIKDASIKFAKQYYTGKKLKPNPTVTFAGNVLTKGVDYTVTYKNNKKIGTATATIKGKGGFVGSTKVKFKILKGLQPMKVKVSSKTLKASKLKKKGITISALKVSKAVGAVTYKLVKTKATKKFKINKKGKITVPKGTKKGTYSVKVKVRAAGNKLFRAGTQTVIVKVTVKK